MRLRLLSFFLFPILLSWPVKSKPDSFSQKVDNIIKDKKAEVGVAVLSLEGADSFYLKNNKHYTIMSVVKFPVALAVLHKVDEGELHLDQKIHFTRDDLPLDTYSPLRDERPEGEFDITLLEVIKYAVSYSDNNCCDKLFDLLGGPQEVEKYVHGLKINDIGIATSYADMGKYSITANWSTPQATVQLLEKFDKGNILSKSSRDALWKLMVESKNPANRIKGLLPAGTIVAHKTGTMSTNKDGINPAFNDVGIVQLPNGKHYAIVVFIANSGEGDENNAKIIAEISKAAWDDFTKK